MSETERIGMADEGSGQAVAEYGRVTLEAIEELQQRIGVERRLKHQYNREVSADAIRHFAHGAGDLNPFWTEPERAEASRFGAPYAPPCFLCSFGMPRSVGLPGVHALYTGSSWQFKRPVRLGTRVSTYTTLRELAEKQGRFAGRQYQEIDEAIYRDEEGNELATLRSHCMRVERHEARDKGKYAELQPHHYSPEEIEEIAATCEAEEIRGADPRYWEDVAVGDSLGRLVRGPLTVTDMIGWLMGWGGMFVRPHGLGVAWRRRHPAAYTLDRFGVPDVPERVHWDEPAALHAGAPAVYDYGPQRIAWLSQVLTYWMGDEGWVRELSVEVRRLNIIADTTWCEGTVKERFEEEGSGLVRCELQAVNQRGETTARGEGLIELPRRPGAAAA